METHQTNNPPKRNSLYVVKQEILQHHEVGQPFLFSFFEQCYGDDVCDAISWVPCEVLSLRW